MTDHAFNTKEVKLVWIPVKFISVKWAEAQRGFEIKRAEKIKDQFDPDSFGFIVVTKPDAQGIYHCADGQHRRAAVEMMWGPDERVPCYIVDADTPERAAKIFLQMNKQRRPPQPLENFKVAVTAGEPDEVIINQIVTKA